MPVVTRRSRARAMSTTPDSHSARYFALLYASAAQRPVLEALLGIEREVFDSLQAGLDHHVAHSRLQWWREECERAGGGRAVHPLTRALVSALNGAPPVDGIAATDGIAAARAREPEVGAAAAAAAMRGAQAAESVRAASGVAGARGAHAVESTGAPPGVAGARGAHAVESTSAPPDVAGARAAHAVESTVESPGVAGARGAYAVESTSAPPGVGGPIIKQQAVPLPQLAGLCGIVDVAVWDLAGATFETRRELDAYCQRWATGMIETLVAASISPGSPDWPESHGSLGSGQTRGAQELQASPGAPGPRLSQASPGSPGVHQLSQGSPAMAASSASGPRTAAWRAVGAAMREVELLTDFAREAHYGRIRLPLDELESANVDTNVLAKPPWPDAVSELIRARLRSLRIDIERNLIDLDGNEQSALRGLLVWAAFAWRTAQRAERALPNRLQPTRFDAISDAWFAWRIARRATIGRFRLS